MITLKAKYMSKKLTVDELLEKTKKPAKLALSYHSFYEGKGCSKCNQTGFSGREAIIEQIIIDDDFSELITNNASVLELCQLAKRKGLSGIKEVALKKAIAGITSLEEVIYETMAV